jgi:hypothetical protein
MGTRPQPSDSISVVYPEIMGTRPPPSYDEVCTELRRYREQLIVVEEEFFDEFFDGNITQRIIERTGRLVNTLEATPAGGEAPETLFWRLKALDAMPFQEQAVAEQRFILAVQGLVKQKRIEDELSQARLDLERARMRCEDHAV